MIYYVIRNEYYNDGNSFPPELPDELDQPYAFPTHAWEALRLRHLTVFGQDFTIDGLKRRGYRVKRKIRADEAALQAAEVALEVAPIPEVKRGWARRMLGWLRGGN